MKTKMRFIQLVVFGFCLLSSVNLFSQTIYAEEHKVFDGIDKLEVKGSFCDVEIIGSDRLDVKFDGEIKGSSLRNKKFEIKYDVSGDKLMVWIDSPFSFSGRIESKLQFKVPSDTEVLVKNSSGDVYCEGLVAKYTSMHASSGDIGMQNMKGDLELETSSGEISVKNHIGNLDMESTSGDQEIKEVVGNISTQASSGDLEFKYIEGDISSRTTSGDIEIDNLVGRLKNVSSSGSMEIDNSKVYLHLTASSGDIEGNNLLLVGEAFFYTTSGNIDLKLRNDPDQLSFDLVASSGNLRAGNRKADKKLYLRNGEIWIHGKSSSGDQSYY
ncbi:DUF4097 family beta strand repeat-containing protein [Marinifilum sp. D714]|uniref:DUF4097 family beta strand repeat-containing protein n=1 Tax=Marinifilum sp. D714 TaxID=2937523 RepID=UPI0027C60040|nr:DUF4097 family beta strand repeat-containing protein [Marinifilum sp. D714]MDQ2178138.1 DUF4097 domain-containing protein [Marinifilum sp. D714]